MVFFSPWLALRLLLAPPCPDFLGEEDSDGLLDPAGTTGFADDFSVFILTLCVVATLRQTRLRHRHFLAVGRPPYEKSAISQRCIAPFVQPAYCPLPAKAKRCLLRLIADCADCGGKIRTLEWLSQYARPFVIKAFSALLLLPLFAGAQAHQCQSKNGEMTLPEVVCLPADKAKPALPPPANSSLALRKPTGKIPDQQSQSQRLEIIRQMLRAGKLSKARQYASSVEERALVREMDRGHAAERKGPRIASPSLHSELLVTDHSK